MRQVIHTWMFDTYTFPTPFVSALGSQEAQEVAVALMAIMEARKKSESEGDRERESVGGEIVAAIVRAMVKRVMSVSTTAADLVREEM